MIKVLLTSSKEEIAAICGEYERQTGFKPNIIGKPTAITFVAILEKGEKWLGSVIYNGFNWEKGKMVNCQALAVGSPNWCQAGVLYYIFAVPFYIYGVNRFTVSVVETNKKSIEWINKLGFTYEGGLRKAIAGQYDRFIYGMLKDECKWLTHKKCLKEMKRYYVDSKLQALLAPYQE